MPDPVAQASTETAGAETAPEALHEAAYTAVESWRAEADEAKKPELWTKADAAVKAAKTALEAQKAAAAANKPPDKYELALPKETLLDPKRAEDVAAFAKEHKLSQAAAAKILEREHGVVDAFFKGQQAEVHKIQEGWLTENLAAVGGDKVKLEAMAERASRVVKKFDTADGKLAAELKSSGLGNHPALLGFLDRIFGSMDEDQLVTAGSETADKKSAAQTLFSKSLADLGVGTAKPQ